MTDLNHMEEGVIYWVGFMIFVLIMLLLDLGVFHKKDSVITVKSAIIWSVFWIALALLFNVFVYFDLGSQKALEFFTAYVLEKSLSVDNLFVFILIFSFFSIKPEFQHRILFWGIFGALVMRAIFIFLGVALINQFSWIMYIFGVFLVYSGIKILFDHKEETDFDPDKSKIIRGLRKIIPITNDNPHAHFFVRHNGVLHATTFFVVLIFIEISDLVFAVDSIPAVLSVSKDVFIVFTSNIFAILGLRSLYFALNGIMEYFAYLKYALAGILSFIGIKMCVNELSDDLGYSFHISNYVSLGVIITLLTIAILVSIAVKQKNRDSCQ